MSITTIADMVSNHVNFESFVSYTSWNKCYCEVCGDGSRTKGPRGGWLFSDEMAFYRCFNCGQKGSFDPNRDHPISRDMREVFEAFGIDPKDAMALAYQKKMDKPSSDSTVKPKINLHIPTYPFPDYFYPLAGANNIIADAARKKLWDSYKLKDSDYPFYLSSGSTKSTDPKEKSVAVSMLNRIIIPFYKNKELMYFQGRSIEDKGQRWLNMNVPKNNIIFNMDAMWKNHDRPLYIFEGAFDAIHVDGVAVLENNLSATQIELLNRCHRRKVIVPDIVEGKIGENKLLQLGVFQQNWGVALPELGSGSKDLSEGINRYGKLFILKSLIDNTFFGDEAKLRASILNYSK